MEMEPESDKSYELHEYLNTKEVAELLRIGVGTVYRLIRARKLKAVRLGVWKIKRTELDELFH